MNVALLTIWHEHNFGAFLQTYATVRTLQELGHEVRLIDYRLNDLPTHPSIRTRLLNALDQASPETKSFEHFWRLLPRTRYYRSLQELKEDPPSAELYLVGSDQVWNPRITRAKAKTFFLPFGNQQTTKAAYASSMGSDQWSGNQELTAFAEQQFQKFKAISCREKEGAESLSQLFHRHVEHVLDPSLLRQDYRELTGEISAEETLAYYALYPTPRLEQMAREIARKMELRFTDANKKWRLFGRIPWQRTTIDAWIRTIAQSRFVITHSFHGLALSLTYQRPFMVIYPKGDKRSTRITSLLDALGLSERFFASYEEALHSHIWEKEIDYTQVSQKLQALRDSSMIYLQSL